MHSLSKAIAAIAPAPWPLKWPGVLLHATSNAQHLRWSSRGHETHWRAVKVPVLFLLQDALKSKAHVGNLQMGSEALDGSWLPGTGVQDLYLQPHSDDYMRLLIRFVMGLLDAALPAH